MSHLTVPRFSTLSRLLALCLLPLAATSAQAGGIDPDQFRVGHPASPQWKAVHANAAHPAVQVAARHAAGNRLDANVFIVQPPASTTWVVQAQPMKVAAHLR